jgi:muconolactone delta-isomerase
LRNFHAVHGFYFARHYSPIRSRKDAPAEQARVRELQQQGVLDALYVPDGAGAPDGLWAVFNGESRDAVQRVIESLPLYPYMQLDLIPLRNLQAGR